MKLSVFVWEPRFSAAPQECLGAPLRPPCTFRLQNYARFSQGQSICRQQPPLRRHASHALWRPHQHRRHGDPTTPPPGTAIKHSFIICWLILCLPPRRLPGNRRFPLLPCASTDAWRLQGHRPSLPNKGSSQEPGTHYPPPPPPKTCIRRGGGGSVDSWVSRAEAEPAQGQARMRHLNVLTGDTRRASPIKLSSPQWRGLENWHLHWESVSSFVQTNNFHLCRNRFAPKGAAIAGRSF